MRKVALVAALLIIGGCFSGCVKADPIVKDFGEAARAWWNAEGEGLSKDVADSAVTGVKDYVDEKNAANLALVESRFGNIETRFDKNEDGVLGMAEKLTAIYTLQKENKDLPKEEQFQFWQLLLAVVLGYGGVKGVRAGGGAVVAKIKNGS